MVDVVSAWPVAVAAGIPMAFGFAVLLFAISRIVRGEKLAGWIFAALMAFGLALRDQITDPAILLALLLSTGVMAAVLLRFGLLASATMLVLGHLIILYPTTRYSDSWLTSGSTVLAFTVPLVAAYGAWIATLGSRTATTRSVDSA